MPNILLNKREELLPLLLLAIQHHPDAQTRDQLLNILFNLMKKPDADQRKVILKGFKKIAKYLGHDKVEAELLPQLWEQIDHKVTRVLTVVIIAIGVRPEDCKRKRAKSRYRYLLLLI